MSEKKAGPIVVILQGRFVIAYGTVKCNPSNMFPGQAIVLWVARQTSADSSAHVLYSAATLAQRRYSATPLQREDTTAQSHCSARHYSAFCAAVVGSSEGWYYNRY